MNNVAFLMTIFLLGFRHGFDFDHIAAISDITGASRNVKSGFFQSVLYILGHAVIVLILGLLAISIGFALPESYGSVLEILVALSLIVLGIYLLVSIIVQRGTFQLVGRGTLLVKSFQKLFFSRKKHAHSHSAGRPASFFVGVLHGIGAETPSQLLLLSLAGIGGQVLGSTGLVLFIIGLMLANTAVSIFSLFGYSYFATNPWIRISLGVGMAAFSLYVGFSVFLS